MKNLKISKKLIVSFSFITIFATILAFLGIFTSNSINSNYVYLLEEPVGRQILLKSMQLEFMTMRYRAANYVMNTGDAEFINGTSVPQFEAAYKTFSENLTQYIENNHSDIRRDSEIIKQNIEKAGQLSTLMEQFIQASDKTKDLSISGDMQAADASLKEVIPVASEINAIFSELITPTIDFTNETTINMEQFANTLMIVQLAMTVVCLTMSVVFAIYISSIISKPVTFIKNVLHMMGMEGVVKFSSEDYKQAEIYAEASDEVGESIKMLIKTCQRLESVGQNLETVSNGNLTIECELLSEKDTMGIALKKMIDNLNSMFREISQSSNQVLIGSNEVSNGSQSLAQGSTEQASSVEELSASIYEVAEKTKHNAGMAQEAASLSDSIKGNAENGNNHMNQLMKAVNEINEASQSISKVIKVIDEIAFQTNILALNAAVEAARAGQHGKGFAVVADEVRNLAAKSAESAKDTGVLIANTIEKSNLGLNIATETTKSLNKIVEGINRSAQIVSAIADSSNEQAGAISQINIGIEQVSQVIQQNSATAEESAAASEEMSAQAAFLQELISRFKLKIIK